MTLVPNTTEEGGDKSQILKNPLIYDSSHSSRFLIIKLNPFPDVVIEDYYKRVNAQRRQNSVNGVNNY